MTSLVSTGEVGKRVIELLGLKPGTAFEISKLRDGSILLRKAETPGAGP
jgi:hypothetical protein